VTAAGFALTLQAKVTPERDQLIADLWDAGTTGITEEDHWVRAFFGAASDPDSLMQQFADFQPTFEEQEEYDWVKHSQSMWHPFEVGQRFWLVPEWLDDPAPEGRLRLPIRPGMACGSGWHPATRLCLEALEQQVTPGVSVLDVGTGSGILAEAALLLGARFVAGCDIDHDATLVAHANLPELPLFTGSLRSVKTGAFDMVVANLNAATIQNISADLARVATGPIILSGFRENEQVLTPREIQDELELDDWSCIVC